MTLITILSKTIIFILKISFVISFEERKKMRKGHGPIKFKVSLIKCDFLSKFIIPLRKWGKKKWQDMLSYTHLFPKSQFLVFDLEFRVLSP